MKGKGLFVWMLALVLVFGIAATGCNNDDPAGTPQAGTVSYTSKDAVGNTYKLVITEDLNRAAYEAQPGDGYVLTITETGGTVKTSKGTVQSLGSGILILLPAGTSATFNVTVTGGNMTGITGTIALEGGGTASPPGVLTPVSGSPFEGSWQSFNYDGMGDTVLLIFSGNAWTQIIGGTNDFKGTFTYTATTLTLTLTHSWNGSSWAPYVGTVTGSYSISGSTLTYRGSTFVKQ
jgi:hypothetical protein